MATKTPELLAEIEGVIANDATLCGKYRSDIPGEMCVLGGLAHHAGIEFPPMTMNFYRIRTVISFATKLADRYALSLEELDELQSANDSVGNDRGVSVRRAKLRVVLNEIWHRKLS